ncbi:tRNA pseudouridine(38-40) synthase TruA [Candidatus Calescamantes bacterium]|nr:tRNA pseudouridine(38-40) synthase TruA [Candidatus Calescamantes bacterium]
MKKNYLLLLEYDGTHFYGWQKQKNKPTVQGAIEEVLNRIFQERIKLIGQGRIDAGVHALGQTANFLTSSYIPTDSLRKAINSLLPSSIRVVEVKEVSLKFHARFSAISRTYLYLLWLENDLPVFLRSFFTLCPFKIKVRDMVEGSKYLLGRHDFSAFCSGKDLLGNKIREIYRIEIKKRKKISLPWGSYRGEILEVEIEGNAFLKQMVRNIVGTLVEVGRGRFLPEKVKEILISGKRENAGPSLPPQGLFLKRVRYPETIPL